jgi:hypothetical protein
MISVKKYNRYKYIRPKRRNYIKAGVFIYDPGEDRVLLVQSRGHLWGPPKGSLEYGENEIECAVREVKEETGIDVSSSNFLKATKIKNRAIYFYMEMDKCDVTVQNNINDEINDANGITWIKRECLSECIYNGHIVLNQHCKIVFKRYMDQIFPKAGFTLVHYNKKGYIASI